VQTGERQSAPPSLTAVIEQRLSMLDQPALQLLQACALLEKNATLGRIERTLGYPLHQLLSSITDLSSLGMIVLEPDAGAFEKSARLSPRHELLANAAENRLAPAAKAFLHRQIGVVLESETDDKNSSAVLWDCAKHWRQAGDSDRAYSVARSCATHLMDLGLCSEAAQAYEKALAYCTSDNQRFEILQRQSHAYFRASDWQNFSSVVSRVKDYQKRFNPSLEIHDDIELMDFRAAWQRGGEAGIIDKALTCLKSEDASLDHRCRAGIMALMLMNVKCDLDGMRSTYRVLRPLMEDDRVDRSHRFEAGMIFETVCGDLNAVLPLARELVEARRSCESIADLMRALANSATAARTAGHFDEARQWLKEAIAIADSHKLPHATEAPLQILASMALDDNDLPEARKSYDRLLSIPESSYDTASRAVRDAVGVRISLAEGNLAMARSLVHSDFEELASDPIAYRRTYGLALSMAVQLANGELPDDATTLLLESSHLAARKFFRQGFATFVLVSTLRRKGKAKRANQLLKEYLGTYRREKSKPPLHLLEMIESFPMTLASH
jgi:tetratricopeptide (TPR) repeat protein